MTSLAQYRGDIIIWVQGILEIDILSGSGVGHGTPDFDALSERSNYRRESQSTVAGPPSCASVVLRRKLFSTCLRISTKLGSDSYILANVANAIS